MADIEFRCEHFRGIPGQTGTCNLAVKTQYGSSRPMNVDCDGRTQDALMTFYPNGYPGAMTSDEAIYSSKAAQKSECFAVDDQAAQRRGFRA